MDSRKLGLTEGTIWKQLLLFFFPILIGTFFQQLYNTVDTMSELLLWQLLVQQET